MPHARGVYEEVCVILNSLKYRFEMFGFVDEQITSSLNFRTERPKYFPFFFFVQKSKDSWEEHLVNGLDSSKWFSFCFSWNNLVIFLLPIYAQTNI